MKVKRSKRLCSPLAELYYFRKCFWFMPVSPWIMDGHFWWSCKYSHEDWRKEPGNNSKNNVLSGTKGDNPHDVYVAEGSLFRGILMILYKFQFRIVWQIVWRRHQRRQKTWSQQWKQGDCWKLTFIQISGHPWSTRPSCLPGVEHFCTREKDVFFLNALRFPVTPTQREGPFHVMFVRNQHTDEQQELNMCEFESQDATKITSVSADSRINFSRTMRSLLVRTSCLCFVLMTIVLSVSRVSPSIVTISSSKSIGVGRVNKWYQKPIREDDDCKDEEQCDLEVEGEDDEWPGAENQRCSLLYWS